MAVQLTSSFIVLGEEALVNVYHCSFSKYHPLYDTFSFPVAACSKCQSPSQSEYEIPRANVSKACIMSYLMAFLHYTSSLVPQAMLVLCCLPYVVYRLVFA